MLVKVINDIFLAKFTSLSSVLNIDDPNSSRGTEEQGMRAKQGR